MRSLVLSTLLLVGCVSAPTTHDTRGLEAVGSAGTVVIWTKPCHQPNQPDWRYAEFHYKDGGTERGCWVTWSGAVLLIFDDNDALVVPQSLFKPAGTTAPVSPGRAS